MFPLVPEIEAEAVSLTVIVCVPATTSVVGNVPAPEVSLESAGRYVVTVSVLVKWVVPE